MGLGEEGKVRLRCIGSAAHARMRRLLTRCGCCRRHEAYNMQVKYGSDVYDSTRIARTDAMVRALAASCTALAAPPYAWTHSGTTWA